MSKRETAAERRAREAEEALTIRRQWEAEKPLRLLWVLARAQMLGMETVLLSTGDDIKIRIHTHDFDSCHDVYLAEMSMWDMQYIEQDLAEREQARDRKAKLQEIRADVMSRLTDEEKEALGLDC